EAKAEVGGKLASVGSRLVEGVAKKQADDFFGKFSEIVGGDAEPAAAAPAEAPAPAAAGDSEGISPMVWGIGLVVVVGLLLYIFAS
ncbi:MAG: SRPBCC domain-containing protein, partial [Rhodospirillales bacterium]|nr:SRPBCC domain-containing protein [Rhodospirillales bacterium]